MWIGCYASHHDHDHDQTNKPNQKQKGVGKCAPNAKKFTSGQLVQIKNGETLLSSGRVAGDSSAPPLVLQAPDSPYVHDAGAFQDYQAFEGGGVSCYNASMNKPFWDAGTCNCKTFRVDADMAKRAARWQTPSTGVVRMFHSARWGGWAFDVDAFDPNGPPLPPPAPPPPPPPPGWGPLVHCTSCQPHDMPIKSLQNGGTLSACQEACVDDKNCTAINFAVDGNQACDLFAACSKPWNDPSQCKSDANDWWTTQVFTRPRSSSSSSSADTATNRKLGGDEAPAAQPIFSITGGQQTGQQGPSSINDNDYYVANIFEELDAQGEFFFDYKTRVLYVVPAAGTEGGFASNTASVVAAVRPRVIQLRGSSPTTFAHDINIKGLTVLHSSPTYMASGGALLHNGPACMRSKGGTTPPPHPCKHGGGGGVVCARARSAFFVGPFFFSGRL